MASFKPLNPHCMPCLLSHGIMDFDIRTLASVCHYEVLLDVCTMQWPLQPFTNAFREENWLGFPIPEKQGLLITLRLSFPNTLKLDFLVTMKSGFPIAHEVI